VTPGGPDATTEVVVVGAGIAGLMAARTLSAAGAKVVVLDKGRGVGGRMATRRLGDAVCDHGAQFFTTPGDELGALAAEWTEAGVIEPWFRGRLAPDGSVQADGHPRWRGRSGMTAVARHLAAGLDVRTGQRVSALVADPTGTAGRWRIEIDGADPLVARSLVLTAPVPQTLALLEAGGAELDPIDAHELGVLAYHPCIAVMAPLDGPSGLAEPGAWRLDAEPIEFLADNQMKGISPVPALTVHLGGATSGSWWDQDDVEIVGRVTEALPALASNVVTATTQVHRWRFARPVECRPEPTRLLRDLPLAVMAGDIFGGPLVGGAARSGGAAGHLLAECLLIEGSS